MTSEQRASLRAILEALAGLSATALDLLESQEPKREQPARRPRYLGEDDPSTEDEDG